MSENDASACNKTSRFGFARSAVIFSPIKYESALMPHARECRVFTLSPFKLAWFPRRFLCQNSLSRRETAVLAKALSAEVPDGDDVFEANTDCFDEIKSAERNTDCFDAVAAQPQQAVSNQVRSRVHSALLIPSMLHASNAGISLSTCGPHSLCAAQDESQGAHLGPL
jgi:hypothetical protein